jgi:nucleoside-diphosphate-sugar epimerase
MEIAATSTTSVFVTGATGVLGREVTKRLTGAGHRVTGSATGSADATVIRQAGGLAAFPNPLRVGELKSAIQAAESKIVLHLASELPNEVPFIDGHWEHYERLWTEGTAALLEAAQSAGVEFVIYGSYAFLYGEASQPVDETAPLLKSNDALFKAMLQAEKQVLTGTVPAAALRMGYLYGPLADSTIQLRESLEAGRPAPTGHRNGPSNWVHVSDAVEALVKTLEQRPGGEVFNIADDHPATPAEFLRYFTDSLGLPSGWHSPAFLNRMSVGKTQAALLDTSVQASSAKAKEKLGWTPKYPSYHEGLDQTLLHWRAEHAVS